MGCDRCAHWRACEDGEHRCWAPVDLCGETSPCDVDACDRGVECIDFQPADGSRTQEIRVLKRITAAGTGLCVYLTREVKSLGLERGDVVEIVIRRP